MGATHLVSALIIPKCEISRRIVIEIDNAFDSQKDAKQRHIITKAPKAQVCDLLLPEAVLCFNFLRKIKPLIYYLPLQTNIILNIEKITNENN